MSKLAALLAIILVLPCVAQAPPAGTTPSEKYVIESPGRDVRDSIHSLFTQAKRNYIVEGSVHYILYLSVRDLDFEKALSLLMDQAKLQFEVRDGIYYIGPAPVTVTVATPGASDPPKADIDWNALLHRKVTLKKQHTPLRSVAASLSQSAGVPIRVEAGVPEYVLNTSLDSVTLKYALDSITKAAKLTYSTDSDGVIHVKRVGAADTTTIVETHSKANVRPAAPTGLKCPSCKGALSTGWKYCPYCGYWVKPITMKN